MSEGPVGIGQGPQRVTSSSPHNGGCQAVGELPHCPHGDLLNQVTHTCNVLVQARGCDSEICGQTAQGQHLESVGIDDLRRPLHHAFGTQSCSRHLALLASPPAGLGAALSATIRREKSTTHGPTTSGRSSIGACPAPGTIMTSPESSPTARAAQAPRQPGPSSRDPPAP